MCLNTSNTVGKKGFSDETENYDCELLSALLLSSLYFFSGATGVYSGFSTSLLGPLSDWLSFFHKFNLNPLWFYEHFLNGTFSGSKSLKVS